jgi:hypothetical protein
MSGLKIHPGCAAAVATPGYESNEAGPRTNSELPLARVKPLPLVAKLDSIGSTFATNALGAKRERPPGNASNQRTGARAYVVLHTSTASPAFVTRKAQETGEQRGGSQKRKIRSDASLPTTLQIDTRRDARYSR